MQLDRTDELTYKACCAALYEHDAIRFLLGDAWRPGGLPLTQEILAAASIGPGDKLLDVACAGADTASAVSELGASYFGVDLSLKSLSSGPEGRLAAAEAERLPFADARFDAVMVQCAFCTFANKPAVAQEMVRVLKPGGRLIIADVTLDCDDLPPELDSIFAAAACIADAQPMASYVSVVEQAGLRVSNTTDRADVTTKFLRSIDQKLFMVRIAQAVKAVDLGDLDIVAARRLLKLGMGMVERGELSYGYLIAAKAASV